ncbi:hypothetical protein [Mesorhizobium sp. BHbdii]
MNNHVRPRNSSELPARNPAGGDLPVTLGRDVSGVVEPCGTRAHTLKKGGPMFAMLGNDRGGNTEYVVVKATEAVAKPERLSHVEAAAMPLAGITACQGLFDHGDPQIRAAGSHPWRRRRCRGSGDSVCKAVGVFVVTTVAAEDFDFLRDANAVAWIV